MNPKPIGEIQCYASYGPVYWGVNQAGQTWEKWEEWEKWERIIEKKMKKD